MAYRVEIARRAEADLEELYRIFFSVDHDAKIIPSRKATKQYLGEEYDDENGR